MTDHERITGYRAAAAKLAQALAEHGNRRLDLAAEAALCIPRGDNARHALRDVVAPAWVLEAIRLRLLVEAWAMDDTDTSSPFVTVTEWMDECGAQLAPEPKGCLNAGGRAVRS
jgi:hypothetical protein